MRTQRGFATLRLLCVLLLAVAVVAGPCQACFDVPVNAPAHNCCPSGKSSSPHQHNASCSDVQVAVEHSKSSVHAPDAIAAPIAAALPADAPVVLGDRLAPQFAVSYTPPPTATLRC